MFDSHLSTYGNLVLVVSILCFLRSFYMFEFNVNKDTKINTIREVVVGKLVTHLCLTLTVKELKIKLGQSRVVTTLSVNHTLNILFSVAIA